MKPGKNEIEKRIKRFEAVAREAGFKLTHQRMEIFREVAESGDHPDAEAVFRYVRERMPAISLDTVYRTLWLLADLGLITTLGFHRGRTRFDANPSRHHHFVCLECGLTRDFNSDDFDGLKTPASLRELGRVESTHVEVRGICKSCSEKKPAKTIQKKWR